MYVIKMLLAIFLSISHEKMHGSTIILIKKNEEWRSYKHWIKIPIIWEMSKKGRYGQPKFIETMSGHSMLSIKDKYLCKQT